MHFANPIGLLALLALPAVLLLHMFRRRFRERQVAGLFLFADDAIASVSGRKKTSLLRSPSLYLELAAALFLALWIAEPRLGFDVENVHIVLVLDDSASMAARGKKDSIKDRVKAAIDSIASDERAATLFTLISTGRRPKILAGPRCSKSELDTALAAWQPSAMAHDFSNALELGLQAAKGDDKLFFLSDTLPAGVPKRYFVKAVGEHFENAAIVNAGRHDSSSRLFVDLRSYGRDPLTTRLHVSILKGNESRDLGSRLSVLPPGKTTRLTLALPKDSGEVKVWLDDDALEIDNSVQLLPEARGVVHVADLLPPELSKLLSVKRALSVLPGLRSVADPKRAELRFTVSAGKLRLGDCEVLIHAAGDKSDAWISPFLLDHRHALLDGLSLQGVIWSADEIPLPGRPLILAGDQPLMSEERLMSGQRLHININAERSNLPNAADWPIFISNLVEHTRARLPGPGKRNLKSGELISYRHRGEAEELEDLVLEDPHGERHRAHGMQELEWEASLPGIHRLLAGGKELARYSVQFVDANESNLGTCATTERPPALQQEKAENEEDEITRPGRVERTVLALLLLSVMLLDWFFLGRRRA